MPRVPAQNVKPRKYCRTEFHPDAEAYLVNLADEMGVNVAYVIRLCVAQSLPEIEELLRSGERPHDEMKKPTKPLKTRVRRPAQIPSVSSEPPPPILEFLETGQMPFVPGPEEAPGDACEPSTFPETDEPSQESPRPDPPSEEPASETLDPVQRKIELDRRTRRR